MIRHSKNLVIATERTPAMYRPANQMLLAGDHSANPQPGDPQSMLPGMGEVRLGNGYGSNGLASGGADARLAGHILNMRVDQAQRTAMLAGAGSPNGKSRPVMTVALNRALADLPAAPTQGALQVDLSFAGNSLQSEQWLIKDGLGLRPIKAFGKKQTFVTTKFGSDAGALQAALKAQPIVSILDIRAFVPQPAVNPVAPKLLWEHVDTIDTAPDANGSTRRWIITKAPTSSGYRFAVTLYRHRADSDDEVVRSDNLATETDARNYIKAYEVKGGNFGGAGRPNRTLMWNGIMRQGGDAGLTNAMARNSRTNFTVIGAPSAVESLREPAAPGTSGLGIEAAAIPAWVIAAAALGAFYLMAKSRYAGT